MPSRRFSTVGARTILQPAQARVLTRSGTLRAVLACAFLSIAPPASGEGNDPTLQQPAASQDKAAVAGSPPSPESSSESSSKLRAVVVEGRAKDMVGLANSSSEGVVSAEQLETRPLLRNAEILEVIPGFIATQHSGSGKANQYFLRGFNLDHGTDFAVRVGGVPVNLPTHAHGQGYLDLNFVIPELVSTVRYRKGPYYAETGDFSSAGSASIEFKDRLDGALLELSGGMYGYGRALLADSVTVGAGDLLLAGEVTYYEGPWKLDEDAIKGNALVSWTRGDRKSGAKILGSAYHADWTATDQIPRRAVRDGRIARRGYVDPTSGGDTSRYTLTGAAWWSQGHSRTRAELYGVYYALDLFSNFTYFLEDPVRGDQIHQRDRRGIFGGDLTHEWYGELLGRFTHETRVGLSLRDDDIPSVALRRSESRQLLWTVREDDVNEATAGVWGESTIALLEKLRLTPGLRADGYRFDVSSDVPENSGVEYDGIVSPKVSLAAGPWANTEGYFNFGTGFHSNDARGVTIEVDPATGNSVDSVDPLVRSIGYEIGVRTEAFKGLHSSVALWLLDLDSELVFVGDAGTTEPGPSSRRYGVEWSNYYEPWDTTALDLDISLSHARFREVADSVNDIPGALPLVISGGITQRLPLDLYTALRLRYLGDYPLTQSGSPRSDSTTLVNLRLGWDPPAPEDSQASRGTWSAYVDFLNLFDSRDNDIAYYYESRLRGEPSGVEDIHFHPVEPFAVRVGIERRFH